MRGRINQIISFTGNIFNKNLHKKRVDSISNALLGVVFSSSLQSSMIGRGLAEARGLAPKHAIKQVDRLIGNQKIDANGCQKTMAESILEHRINILAAIDWTSFDQDHHKTLTIHLITNHGRATPLLWMTVKNSDLKNNQTKYEDQLLARLKTIAPEIAKVTILGDRGFGNVHRFDQIKETLGFSFIIRFKANITITHNGIVKTAAQWLSGARSRTMQTPLITGKKHELGKVVIVKDTKMKDTWCLACSDPELPTKAAKQYYGARWGIETSYRDQKSIRFGMGLSSARVSEPHRREMLLLLSALAITYLTLLGAASENTGYDKYIKSNTATTRTHSLFMQGCLVFRLLLTMNQKFFQLISEEFKRLLKDHKRFSEIFSII